MNVWDQLIMKRRREKGRRKTAVCTNLKPTSIKYGVVLCGMWGNSGKNIKAYT